MNERQHFEILLIEVMEMETVSVQQLQHADWQQAPDGDVPHDTSRDTLPGTEAHEAASASTGSDDASISELLKQALKEQEQDYSQGKIPAPPVDETQDNSQRDVNHKVDARSPLSEKGDRLE